jgi:hypothetical protein
MSAESRTKARTAPEAKEAVGLDADELEQRLAQFRADVSNGRVPEARAAVKELSACGPESKRGQHWDRVLAPPRVIPTPESHRHLRPLDRERAWLKEHAREYPGCWLAVYEDCLIAADPDLGVNGERIALGCGKRHGYADQLPRDCAQARGAVVHTEVRHTLGDEVALLHYQPGKPQPKRSNSIRANDLTMRIWRLGQVFSSSR